MLSSISEFVLFNILPTWLLANALWYNIMQGEVYHYNFAFSFNCAHYELETIILKTSSHQQLAINTRFMGL